LNELDFITFAQNLCKPWYVKYEFTFSGPYEMWMQPAANGDRSCIRFTVPKAGYYTITADFFAPGPPVNATCQATTDVHFVINNVEQRSLWINQNSGRFVFKDLYLNYDDYIQFEVGYGKNMNYSCDVTGARITLIRFSD
jgi:hypothetical protein